MSKGSVRRPESTPGKYAEGWDRIFAKAKNTKRARVNTSRWLRGQAALDKLAEGLTESGPYPSWVCFDCATKAGGRLLDPEASTVHTGDCEVCGMTQWVTQPRDYGYPRFRK